MSAGTRRVVGIELRRGAGIWAAPPMIVALAFAVLAHPRDWAGDWSGWAYYLRTSLIVFGPLVLAAAAWQGGRERRRGLQELLATTPRPALHRTLASLASPAVWALAGFGLIVAGMAAVTASNTSYGRPLVDVACSAAAAVLLFAAVGYTLGRLWPWRVAAPVLALAAYIGMAVLSYRTGGLPYLSPGVELYGGFLPAPWWPAASAVTFLAAAAGVLLLLAARRRWIAAPVLGLAVLAAAPIAHAGQGAFTVDQAGQELVCQDGAPQVCLTRRHADQLPAVAEAIHAELAGLDVSGPILEQRIDPQADDEPVTLNSLYLGATISGGADLSVVRQDVAQAVVRWNCPDQGPYPRDDKLASATVAITQWIAHRPAPPDPASPLAGRTDTQMRSVTRAFAAAATTCDLAAARRALQSPS